LPRINSCWIAPIRSSDNTTGRFFPDKSDQVIKKPTIGSKVSIVIYDIHHIEKIIRTVWPVFFLIK
jgi:hypothetical protein